MPTIEEKIKEFDERFGRWDLNETIFYRDKIWSSKEMVKEWIRTALTEIYNSAIDDVVKVNNWIEKEHERIIDVNNIEITFQDATFTPPSSNHQKELSN